MEHDELISPGQNGRHFADDIFKYICVNESVSILIKISLKFVAKGPIDINPVFGLDNGLVPSRRQAIIWTKADSFTHIYGTRGGGMS